jgi:murein DD-endopeptidase MepM/ murein hydrolase activator NlpD
MKAPVMFILALVCGAFTAGLAAQTLVPPESVRRGEPGFAWLLQDQGKAALYGCSLVVVFADGRKSPRHLGFAHPAVNRGQPWVAVSPAASTLPAGHAPIAFVFAVPVDAVPGDARMVVSGPFGQTIAEAWFRVADRSFAREDIRLDSALSSLRIDPDPRKTEQAVKYRVLLAWANPAAGQAETGFVRPVDTDRRTSLFGTKRRYLYADGGVDVSTHWGVDYGCPTGTPVRAALSGRVVMAEDRIVTGNTVVIEHFPAVFTIYMHLETMVVVQDATVGRGETIGTVGATGLATGPHLHWELRVAEVACDPEALVGIDKSRPIRTILPAIEGR